MRGKYIEEFEVGQVDESRARTITETDAVTFSWMSGDVHSMETGVTHLQARPRRSRAPYGPSQPAR
jgi:hypothetical protein